ncbi:MAG TPA: HAD-IA family hydrolase [Rhodocyclaceae bacterium]|nr:HAD-IA family hydrolase [Rhodocyclaceae bacterium]
MARYELIVFDWDGTLMDSAAAIVAAIMAACRDLGIEPPSEERARHIIGLGLQDAIRSALPNLPARDYGRLAERYRHHYLSRDAELSLFPGARELVADLHAEGRRLAVATGKSRQGLQRALAHSGLGELFHATRCADECFSKPHPAMLLEIMEALEVDRGAVLMVGDTTHDLQMARNAGVDGLAVSFGAHPETALLAERPVACAGSFVELAAWIRENA